MCRHTLNNGFTLIELIIAVAIISILAAVAIPAYQNYTVRAKVMESFTLLASQKSNIVEYFGTHGTLPTTWEQINGMQTSLGSGTQILYSDFSGVPSDLFWGLGIETYPSCAGIGCVENSMYIGMMAIEADSQLRKLNNGAKLYVGMQIR